MVDFSKSTERSSSRYARYDEIVAKLTSRSVVKRLEGSILVPTDVLMPSGVNIVAVIKAVAV